MAVVAMLLGGKGKRRSRGGGLKHAARGRGEGLCEERAAGANCAHVTRLRWQQKEAVSALIAVDIEVYIYNCVCI